MGGGGEELYCGDSQLLLALSGTITVLSCL